MSTSTFIVGLLVTFTIPWLALLAVPSYTMSKLQPPEYIEALDGKSGVFVPKRAGNLATGLQIYHSLGCAVCHTQMIRHTDASGADMWRQDWAGIISATEGDTRRESRWFDYIGEDIAPIGFMRIGPDLANLAPRLRERVKVSPDDVGGDDELAKSLNSSGQVQERAESWLYLHLFNPRDGVFGPDARRSKCDAHPSLFELKSIGTERNALALPVDAPDGMQYLPKEKARRLVNYLMSMQRNDKLPQTASFRPKQSDD